MKPYLCFNPGPEPKPAQRLRDLVDGWALASLLLFLPHLLIEVVKAWG